MSPIEPHHAKTGRDFSPVPDRELPTAHTEQSELHYDLKGFWGIKIDMKIN